tara:strand:+ start:1570 stop:2181 length:612 start_codon:yes stop_codon:yes gene_type:complete
MRFFVYGIVILFFLNSCSSMPDYSSYPQYFRDNPESPATDIKPGTTLDCFFDEGGVAQYYFGLNPEKEIIVARYFEIPSTRADTIDRHIIMQVLNKIKPSSEKDIVLWEVERTGNFTNQCPYTRKDSGTLVTNMFERTTKINRNTLKFIQTYKQIFVDQTNEENPVCRVSRISNSLGYCTFNEGSIPNHREWIELMINPSKQL